MHTYIFLINLSDKFDLVFVDEDEVPSRIPKTKWEKVFEQIPEGKALTLQPEDVKPITVRQALRRQQKKGKFKNLVFTSRSLGNKRYMSYIINPRKSKK